MGKVGRFACIFTPMALTIASLVCLALVMSGQITKNMQISQDLYFFKAITKDFTANPDDLDKVKDANNKLPDNFQFDSNLLNALQGAKTDSNLKDFYKVGLWNYCEGDIDDKGVETVTKCTDRQNYFWFNPIDVWKLEGTSAQKLFGDDFQKGLDAYQKVSKWMFLAYIFALLLTILEILIGISALFSRWGSMATTIVSTLQTIFIFAAAITSTTLYASIVGVFKTVLEPYNIEASMGKQMLSVVWIGVTFSLGSGFFWLISTCCCSGKSDKKKVVVEKTPYTYERVASPYLGASSNGHAMQDMHHQRGAAHHAGHGTSGNAFEPYRHGGARA